MIQHVAHRRSDEVAQLRQENTPLIAPHLDLDRIAYLTGELREVSLKVSPGRWHTISAWVQSSQLDVARLVESAGLYDASGEQRVEYRLTPRGLAIRRALMEQPA